MNRKPVYGWLWVLVVVVLITALFFPDLMDYDSAEYAGISMQMFKSGDWGTILNRTYTTGEVYDYLDKPHVLYWSSFPGFGIFGVTHQGYRLVSVLLSLVAAWATYRTGLLLYSERVGRMSALFFISSQTILLANHDVRTDTLLTAFTILAIFHLVCFIKKGHWKNIVFAGAFLAAGVGTKGLIIVLVAGSTVGAYLMLQPGGFKKILRWQWLLLPVAFFFFLSPVLYHYYLQFDLHPEKMVNGSTGTSGVKFLLWSQSFERFAGDRAFVDNPEFSFFFHTFLWVFLPWSLITYSGVASKIMQIVRSKGHWLFRREQLTFTGVWAIFIFMSLSSFKLPHYLNILIPLFSIFTASYLGQLQQSGHVKVLKVLSGIQYFIISVLVLLALVLFTWAFPLKNIWVILSLLLLLGYSVYWFRNRQQDALDRVWIPSAITILLVNFVLNTHFYPSLDKYQGGSSMARYIKANDYPIDSIYLYEKVYRTFDFYLSEWRPMLTNETIHQKLNDNKPFYIFTNEEGKAKLDNEFMFTIEHQTPDYHITMLDGKFINPKTRDNTYGYIYLLKLMPRPTNSVN